MRLIGISILVLILMAVCIAPSQSQKVDFTFTCEGTDSTMTSYAYMKEPSLQDSGYTRGLKTGSFNYFEGGDINLTETIKYKYGNGTENTSKSVTHTLDVNFSGTRGISEFYGKGFFRNNRAISAWKKIRYENLSRYENLPLTYSINGVKYSRNGYNTSISRNGYSTSTLGKARTAKSFIVDASVEMGSGSGTETFDFDYIANASDAVIETKDAAGWANRTGARRIDFEHDTMMSGEQLNITNVLKDSAPFPVEAGGDEDWLSCCIGGTERPYYPAMDNNDSWPNDGTYRTLLPAKKLPNVNRTQEFTVDPWGNLRCSEPKYEKFSCNDTNCSGFECINEFGPIEREDKTAAGGPSVFAEFTSIGVTQRYETPRLVGTNEWVVTYKILVENSGVTKLTNVTLNDTLPLDMEFIDSNYERLDQNLTNRWVRFSLGELNTGENKTVVLNASHEGEKGKSYYMGNKVYVVGEARDGRRVNATSERAQPPRTTEGESSLSGDGVLQPW